MKIRLDQYLVQHGLIQSRERAKAMIMSGVVFVNEQKVDKAGEMIKEDAKVEVRGHDIGYVSRGGLKLEKAMQCFPLTPKGKVCMDIGASTGGFTDCMLQNGAVKVYAVDVGYGQLALKPGAKKWARTAWCVTPPPTAKCCTMPWAMRLPTDLLCAGWISAR